MRLRCRCKSSPAISVMTCRQKSSCWEEYSISSGKKSLCRISSLLSTRPPERRASSRASVVLPVPGRPAISTIMSNEIIRGLVRGIGGGRDGSGLRPFHWNDILRFAPVGVAARNHNVEYPLMPLLFRFNQAEGFHVKEVVLHPVNLFRSHAPALQVDRKTREMRGGGIALRGRSIAVVPAKFFLDL